MTDTALASRRTSLTLINVAANLGFLALYLVPILILDRQRVAAALGAAHSPDVGLIASAPPLVLIHLASVVAAMPIGLLLLIGLKGAGRHRTLGWTWVGLVAVGAVSSFFLRDLAGGGGFSGFHIATAIVAVLLPFAVLAARTHRVRWHAALMVYLLFGIVSTGLFAVYPGFTERLLPRAIYAQGDSGAH